jgi:hypothetical protein
MLCSRSRGNYFRVGGENHINIEWGASGDGSGGTFFIKRLPTLDNLFCGLLAKFLNLYRLGIY